MRDATSSSRWQRATGSGDLSQARFARDGGLMGYGNSLTDMYRLVVVYVARILKGEEPADLPVVQSSKFELAIESNQAMR